MNDTNRETDMSEKTNVEVVCKRMRHSAAVTLRPCRV